MEIIFDWRQRVIFKPDHNDKKGFLGVAVGYAATAKESYFLMQS